MPLDPRAQRLLRMVAAAPQRDGGVSLAARREQLDGLMRLGHRSIADVEVAAGTLPGAAGPLASRVYLPAEVKQPGAALIYLHGGGLVAGSLDSHDDVARALARACGVRVVAVAYRLAPEHRFPAALDDALNATAYLCEHAADLGIAPDRLALCGDSAGAALAAATCQTLSASGRHFALLLLLCPILDYSLDSASRREFARGFLVEESQWQQDLALALPPSILLDDPRLSPLRAPLPPAMPRTLIHTAEFDPMRDDGAAYRDKLERQGMEVFYSCHPGMIHLFYGLAALLPYADSAFEQIGAQVRQTLA